jgi:hypothetical protein
MRALSLTGLVAAAAVVMMVAERVWPKVPASGTLIAEVAKGGMACARSATNGATTNATNTRLVTLDKGKQTQVPIRIHDDFKGPSIEVRAVDLTAGRSPAG